MFLHYYKYRLISLLHMKEVLWWNLLFPIILATLFYCAFGNLMGGNEDAFDPIKIAVVTESDNEMFTEVLDSLSESSEDSEDILFITTKTDEETAKQMLKDNEVKAIIYVNEKPSVCVAEDGISQTITQSFVTQYLAQADLITNIMKDHPENLQAAIDQISEDTTYSTEVSLTNADYDPYLQYFYALIAMTCLYGASAGIDCIISMQANMSALGMRREASPQHKLIALLSDFFGTLTLQFAGTAIMFFYMLVVLGIDFGTKIPLIILTGFAGTLVGVSLGIFLGSVTKGSAHVKTSIGMTVVMLCSFLSGLMFASMKDIIEHHCPIVNRLNPAALISDALYALNLYNTYDRFARDMIIMVVMSAVFCFISYLILRRNKYASL